MLRTWAHLSLPVSLVLLAGACGADDPTEAPVPPALEFPLAASDPRAHLDPALLGLPVELGEGRTPDTAPDPVASSQGVRFVLATGAQTTTPAPTIAETGNMILPGDPGLVASLPATRLAAIATQNKVYGGDDRVLVPDTLGWPARALVKIYIGWKDGSGASCSGTLIGRKSVLTAGHCVYNPGKGGWAASLQVVPGQDGSYMPFGNAYAVYIDSVTGWTSDQNNDYDYSMLTLDRNIGDATGWLGLGSLSDASLDSLVGAIQGYPGDLSGGSRQYVATGSVLAHDSTMIYYRIDTMPGDSGAIFHGANAYQDYIVGVHTGSSWYWLSDYNRATRINNARYYQILDWMNQRASLGTVGEDFTHWAYLGGAIYTRPTAVSVGNGRYDVFVRGTDGAVYHKARTPAAWLPSLTGYESLGGGITGSPAAVSRMTSQLDLFVRGGDGGVWTKAWNGTYGWWPSLTGWAPLGGFITGNPAAVSYAWNRLDVFARDAGGSVVWSRWAGAGWSPFVSLGGQITDSPAAASWGPNRIDLVARGVAGNVLHAWYDGSYWSGWEDLGGYINGTPTIVSPAPGVLEIVVRGGDDAAWHRRFQGGWSGWIYLGGNLSDEIAVVSRAYDQIDLFARDKSGAIFTKAWSGAYGWWPGVNDWAWLGGDMLGTPAAVATGPSDLSVITRGSENSVRMRWWDGTRWWF